LQDILELVLDSTFNKTGIQGMASSQPVSFHRSFGEGLAFGGVMAYYCARGPPRSKQILAAAAILFKQEVKVYPGVSVSHIPASHAYLIRDVDNRVSVSVNH